MNVFENIAGVLTGAMIRHEVEAGEISISNFNENQLNPNSYNLRIGSKIATIKPNAWKHRYARTKNVTDKHMIPTWELDIKKPVEIQEIEMDEEKGFLLRPHQLYLIATEEIISCGKYIPIITGRSTMGRMGIAVHREAGFGDIGFEGCFTLQMDASYPTRIYPHAAMAQVYFLTPFGPVEKSYNGKYQGSTGIAGSKSYLDFSSK